MRRVRRVGKVRRRLAELLESRFDCLVDPALLRQNYEDYWHGRSYGFSFSWYYDTPDRAHLLFDVGSGMTMGDMVKNIRDGFILVIERGEIFVAHPELLAVTNGDGGLQ